MVFQDKLFDEFIDYIVNYLVVTLDSFSVKDIYEDYREDIYKIPNPIKEYREIGITI